LTSTTNYSNFYTSGSARNDILLVASANVLPVHLQRLLAFELQSLAPFLFCRFLSQTLLFLLSFQPSFNFIINSFFLKSFDLLNVGHMDYLSDAVLLLSFLELKQDHFFHRLMLAVFNTAVSPELFH